MPRRRGDQRAYEARDRVPGLASPGDATKPPWRQDFTVWSFDGTSAAKSTVGKILPFPNEAGASLGTPFVLAKRERNGRLIGQRKSKGACDLKTIVHGHSAGNLR